MKTIKLIILLVSVLQVMVSCRSDISSSGLADRADAEYLDSLRTVSNRYIYTGEYDSIILCMDPVLDYAQDSKDSLLIRYASSLLTQAYLKFINVVQENLYVA